MIKYSLIDFISDNHIKNSNIKHIVEGKKTYKRDYWSLVANVFRITWIGPQWKCRISMSSLESKDISIKSKDDWIESIWRKWNDIIIFEIYGNFLHSSFYSIILLQYFSMMSLKLMFVNIQIIYSHLEGIMEIVWHRQKRTFTSQTILYHTFLFKIQDLSEAINSHVAMDWSIGIISSMICKHCNGFIYNQCNSNF